MKGKKMRRCYKFSQILIQYHDGADNMIEKLSKIGFKVIEKKYSNNKGQIFAKQI